MIHRAPRTASRDAAHLISKARGETDLLLDDFVSDLDADTRAAGEKAAKPWLDALKGPKS